MKILITGKGFIGTYLSKFISADKIYLMSRSTNPHLDVCDIDSFKNIPDVDVIMHTAAYIGNEKELAHKVNVEGTKNLVNYAQEKNIKIIFSSSCSVYERLPDRKEEDANPISVYGKSKFLAEKEILKNEKNICLRYSSVYGVGQNPNSVISIFLNACLNNSPIKLFNKHRTQDFVYIKDIINANQLALTAPGGAYNIGSGKETSMLDLAQTMVKIFGGIIEDKGENKDLSKLNLNLNNSNKILNYFPKYSLNEGLLDMKKEL